MKVGQGKVCRDDQGLSGAASGVYDVEDLFHGVGRVPFDAQVVDDKKVISGQLVQEFLFIFAEALKFVQDSGKFVTLARTCLSIKAFAMQQARKDFPVPTPP